MKKKAFQAAFPYTLPICVGFLFLGMSYGFMMRSKGFSFLYPLFMRGHHDLVAAAGAFEAEIGSDPEDFPLITATGVGFFQFYDVSHLVIHCFLSVHFQIWEKISPMLPCTRRSAPASFGVTDLLTITSFFPL